MNNAPDYERYTLDELYDVERHIDTEKYPHRYATVLEQIQLRLNEPALSAPPLTKRTASERDHHTRQQSIAHEGSLMIVASVLFVLAPVFWLTELIVSFLHSGVLTVLYRWLAPLWTKLVARTPWRRR